MRLALLPGLDGTGALFGPLVSCLSDNLRPTIVRYPSQSALSIAQLAALAADTLSDAGPWLLLAESFSGPIAIRLLNNRPELRIAGVVFAASFASPPRRRLLRLIRRAPLARLFALTPPDWFIRAFCLGPHAGHRTVALLRETLAAVNPEVMAARMRALVDLEPCRTPIPLPCIYLHPSEDRLVPRASLEELGHLAPLMTVHTIHGPHFILQTAARPCAQVIEAFAQNLERTHNADGGP